MRLVKQTKLGECGPACVATVAGCSLREALDVVGDVSRGVTDYALVDALAEFGVPSQVSLRWPDKSVPAILTVPSLGVPGLLHFIVWDGKRYLDPANSENIYPDAAPVVNGRKLEPQWATAILLWPKLGPDAPIAEGPE
jgi:hypothetical protein